MALGVEMALHLIDEHPRVIALLRGAGIRRIRTMSTASNLLGSRTSHWLYTLAKAGFYVTPVITAPDMATMSSADISCYVKRVLREVCPHVSEVQVLHLPNTAKGWGMAPSAKKSFDVFYRISSMIKETAHGTRVIGPALALVPRTIPGLVDETRESILIWEECGAAQRLDGWAFSYFERDWRKRTVLYGCMDLVRQYSRVKRMYISETGATKDPAWWFSVVHRGIKTIPAGGIYWRCLSHDNGYGLIDATTLAPNKTYELFRMECQREMCVSAEVAKEGGYEAQP